MPCTVEEERGQPDEALDETWVIWPTGELARVITKESPASFKNVHIDTAAHIQ